MAEASLVTQITDWLVDQSLGEPDIVELFEGVCQRSHASASRSAARMLMWSTLHPLFQAENVLWKRGQRGRAWPVPAPGQRHRAVAAEPHALHARSGRHGASPPADRARRSCSISRSSRSSPSEGYTDYLIIGTELFAALHLFRTAPAAASSSPGRPIGRAASPTTTSTALQRIQRRLAIACKTVIQTRISAQHHRGLSRPPDRTSACWPARSASATASRRGRSSGIPTSGTRRASPRRCRARISSIC